MNKTTNTSTPCPKGLSQGPCGGMRDGCCEIHAENACFFTATFSRSTAHEDSRLEDEDAAFRTRSAVSPGAYSDFGWPPGFAKQADANEGCLSFPVANRELGRFERGLVDQAALGFTTEVLSPRGRAGLEAARREVSELASAFDALALTCDHAGKRTLSPLELAVEAKRQGGDAILVIAGRALNRERLESRLRDAVDSGLYAMFCVTGDGQVTRPGRKDAPLQRFGMESSEILAAARCWDEARCNMGGLSVPEGRPSSPARATSPGPPLAREEDRSLLRLPVAEPGNPSPLEAELQTGSRRMNRSPRPLLLGTAINPNARPFQVVLDRLRRKIDSGARFVMTQAVCDMEIFESWLDAFERSGLQGRARLVATLPLVGSERGLRILQRLPGVYVPDAFNARLLDAKDMAEASQAWIREQVPKMAAKPWVAGIHLTRLDAPVRLLLDTLASLRAISSRVGMRMDGRNGVHAGDPHRGRSPAKEG